MLNLTIAIPTKNEELNIKACLSAIGKNFAEKVVIIDSNSSDKTRVIAEGFGAEVVIFNWNGRYPKKRNWYLENHTPSTKWVLFLDADEIISGKFKEELISLLPATKHDAFEIVYTRYFLGSKLHGGYPLRKTALFKVGNIRYEYVNEKNWSKCDMEVHEHPQVCGSVGFIKNEIDHRDERGIESYMNKHNEYAAWEANRIYEALNNKNKLKNRSIKLKIKYNILTSHLSGLIFLFGSYIFMGGWRDGKKGVAFAVLKAGYFTQIYCRLKELELQGKELDIENKRESAAQ